MPITLYSEKIKSNLTSLLFVILALIFFTLFAWRFSVVGLRFFPGLFVFLGFLFIFYGINYRVLNISITDEALRLDFGLFHWRSEMGNITFSTLYDPPFWIKYGGAGVHFAMVDGEYKAFFNFLEYPRISIRFHKKRGWVQALVFTTRQPDRILEILQKRSPSA